MLRILLFASLLVLVGCGGSSTGLAPSPKPQGPSWFKDVTDEVGLDFTHDAGPPPDGPNGLYFMPQIMGSGAALVDVNGDGRLDIVLLQNAGPKSSATHRLFLQGEDGRFRDASKGSGIDVYGYGMGVTAGDVDNDGRPDLLITEYGQTRLLHNRGSGKFEDITRAAGIDNPQWGTSAAFADLDRDGRLDLVILNYVDYDPTRACSHAAGQTDYCHPSTFPGTTARLYGNRGPGPEGVVRFEDRTVRSGLARLPGPGLGVVCADLTGDGWIDIFVANDAQPNRLWVNQKDGTFVDEAVVRGLAFNGQGHVAANMGIALSDVSGSGRLDLFVTHLTEESHTLFRQLAPGSFADRTGAARLAAPAWRATGFGTVMADFDHDGAPDLAIVNGRVARSGAALPRSSFWAAYEERHQLFANDGQGRFQDISEDNGDLCGSRNLGRALAMGDVDGDGALDLLVSNVAGRARLYRNIAPKKGHWLQVRLVDPSQGGREAYGAQIQLIAKERTWLGSVTPNQSYLSSHDPQVHFGLGQTSQIERIQVLWPDGSKADYPGGAVDRSFILKKGDTASLPSGK